MKRSIELLLSAILLVTVFSFAACSTDDDDNAEPSDSYGPIKGLIASLSEENGEWITLDWQELDGFSGRYDVYRSVNGGEFERRGDADKEHFWDAQTERATTYSYYVNVKESYSDTIEITTAPVGMPYAYAIAAISGEGDDAVIDYIVVQWNVGSEDDIDAYEIYRDGELIATEQPGNEQKYRDYDNNLNFDQEYTYAVVAKMSNGDSHESSGCFVTAVRPDAIDRPAPEILNYISDSEEKTVDVIITDVSDSHTDRIQYKGELEGLNYTWDFEHEVNYFGTDDEGNIVIGLSTEGADLPTGQTIWLKSRVRIYTQGAWSEWSDTYRFFIF